MAVDKIVWKIGLDFAVLMGVGAPLLAFLIWGKGYQTGFWEDDRSLRLPFKEETLPESYLAGGAFILMVVTVILTEFVRDKKGRSVGEKFICGRLIPGWVWESYITIGIFTFGGACQQVHAEVTKYIMGRLRPHFFAVCQPIYDRNAPANANGYIQEYSCVDPDRYRVQQVRLSFPSAHASFAMYVAVFWIIYIQIRGKWRGSKLLRHGLQLAMLMAAWFIGLTRITDHFHFWEDIAAGFLIGAVYAALVIFYVLKPKKYAPSSWQESGRQENMLPRPVLAR